MINHRKTAALLMSLLICASAPVYSAFADNEPETTTISESENKISGDFTYSLITDNTACIENCTSTEKDLVIPDTIDGITVTEIGKMAFGTNMNCPYETITIPASIDYISTDSPFSICTNLKEVKIDGSNNNYIVEDGVLYTKDKTKLICYPAKKSGTSFTIPEGVTSIASSAFYFSSLSEIKFPSTLEEINFFTFGNCNNLTTVDLSNTKTEVINSYSFAYCSALSDVKLPDTLMEIGGGAFVKCESLTEITLPDNLQSIGQYSFIGTGLKKIVIPSSVTSIGYCALGYNLSASGYEVMDSSFIIVGEIGSAAYSYATDSDSDYDYKNEFEFRTPEQNKELEYMDGLIIQTSGNYQYAEIEGGAAIIFCASDEQVITVPSELEGIKITEIYPSAFSSCIADEIIVPEGITTVRKLAFYDCQNLKKVTLPQSVTLIEDNAFDGCSMLETADLGGAVTVGSEVFNYCYALKELTISGNCTAICIEDEAPFYYLTSLEKVNVTDGDGAYSSKDGVLYNKDKSVLVHYPQGKTDKKFTVPESVKELADDSFSGNSYLEEVDLSHVEIIGISAFENCENLSSVKLSKNLKKVDSGAFYHCKKLKEVRLYTSDTEIGDFSFGYYYDETISNDNGTTGKSAIVEGFKLYTNKSKDDTGVDYARKNNIEAVTNTVSLLGKNVRKDILWISGGGIGLLLAALIGSHAIKKSKLKKNSAPSKKISEEKENKEETNEKEKEDDEK